MLPWNRLVAVVLALCAVGAHAQPEEQALILPQSEAKPMVGKTMEPKLVTTGTWDPTETEVGPLEANLNQIANLSHANSSYRRIEHPEKYFRQYLGLLAGSRKFIYVNAFCGINDGKPPREWRSKLVVIWDGGSCVWQAIYDVSTNKFISLSVNGVG